MSGATTGRRFDLSRTLVVLVACQLLAPVAAEAVDTCEQRTCLAVENCENGVVTGVDGELACKAPTGSPSQIGYTVKNMTYGLPPYSVVVLNGANAGEVVAAPAGANTVFGCAQNASTLYEGQQVFVITAGMAKCRSNIALPNDVLGMDPDNAAQLKTLTFAGVPTTLRRKWLGFRLQPPAGLEVGDPADVWLFGGGYQPPTTYYASSYSATLSPTTRYFAITGIETNSMRNLNAVEVTPGEGVIGQVDCTLSATPPQTLTVTLLKDDAPTTSCTMTGSQTCSMSPIDQVSTTTNRWALSAALASGSTAALQLNCTTPFTRYE